MRQIINVFVGSQEDCFERDRFAIVHACKHPCYTNVSQEDKMLISYEFVDNMYLNVVDSVTSTYFSPFMFKSACDFIMRKKGQGKDILIHCNEGQSRSAAIALVWLARNEVIPNETYLDAHQVYIDLDPLYYPGTGIINFMRKNWDTLMR